MFCLRFPHPPTLRFSSPLETPLLPPTSRFLFVLTQACRVFISLCYSRVQIYPPAPALTGKVSVSSGKCGYLTPLPRQARQCHSDASRPVIIRYVRVPVVTETTRGASFIKAQSPGPPRNSSLVGGDGQTAQQLSNTHNLMLEGSEGYGKKELRGAHISSCDREGLADDLTFEQRLEKLIPCVASWRHRTT